MEDPGLLLRDDGEHIGHAILRFAVARESAPHIALRFIDGTFLGMDGRRGKARHAFATRPVGDLPVFDFRLGPEVTAHIREAELVTFMDADGCVHGTASWDAIRVQPIAGTGVRLGPGARPRPLARLSAPVVPGPAAAPLAVTLPPAGAPGAVEPDAPLPPQPLSRPKRRGILIAAFGMAAVAAVAFVWNVLSGFLGWRLEPAQASFLGPVAGPFAPDRQKVALTLAWYAKPFLRAAAVKVLPTQDWVALKQVRSESGLSLDLSPSASAAALPSGRYEARLQIVFPLRLVPDAGIVSITVEAAKQAPDHVVAKPASPPPPATINDAACDRLAGNRFDGDRPATAGFMDEIFSLSQADLDAGLAACDPGRTGRDRRFAVQRGRLLAQRAQLRLAGGDDAGATLDMDAAVAFWRHGESLGSAYAGNLLGAFYAGTFNRNGHVFVQPDDGIADGFWKKAMDGGSIVAARNYAAQLLTGKGVPADPRRAIALLRDAADKGDLQATGVLGEALFTGVPPGVAMDKGAGWSLLVAAQCADKSAAILMERVIASGAKPASARRSCL